MFNNIEREGVLMKKGTGKAFLGEWNTKTIVTMAVGAALYGVLMVYGGIPIFSQTNLSTAMIVPVIVGAMYGALPCSLTLLIGNIIADLIAGNGMWFDWSIGNAVLGLFVGLLPVYGAYITEGIFKVKHAVIYGVLCVVGNIIAFGIVTPIFTYLFYGGELKVTFIMAGFACAGNIAILLIVGIPVLFLLAKRYASRTNLTAE
mgnify:FL=1